MNKTAVACSTKNSTPEAVNDIREQMGATKPKAVVYFASSAHEPEAISRAMEHAFPGAIVFGCSTAGEITSGKMLKGSLVAMGLTSNMVADMALGVVPDVSKDSVSKGIADVFASFGRQFGAPMSELDFSEYVGLILIDGLSAAEERVMDKIGDLTNVLFVGGSAGDDLKFSRTHVYANGKAYTDTAILVLLKPATGFEIIKTQSFRATGKYLTATEVNEATREVVSFDNKAAAVAYAEAVGSTVDDAPNHFMSHPLGLLADGEIFVRSPQQIKDGKMVFYCNVLKGMEMALLTSTDIVADTRAAIEAKSSGKDGIAALINFNCILRTLELEKDNLTESYGKVFSDIPTVGFSTYGEEYLGHINQTATMLLLK
jgi:hypothetical protein